MINKISVLNGAKYFYSGLFQNYLVFIPVKKDIKYFSDSTRIELWKSNGMSQESIGNITKSDSNFFNGHCLVINNISIPKKVKTTSYLSMPQKYINLKQKTLK